MTEEEWLKQSREHSYAWASDDQWACVLMLIAMFRGEHHLPGEIKAAGRGVRISAHASRFSTYDYSDMTRLVFMAHDRCIRAELCPSGPGRIGIMLHKRHKREGEMHERHPTLEQAVAEWRSKNPAETAQKD